MAKKHEQTRWLSELGLEWQLRPGQQLLELGDTVVYGMLRLGEGSRLEGLAASLAHEASTVSSDLEALPDSLSNLRLLELGLILHLARASEASHIFRTQAYFPAVLVERLIELCRDGSAGPGATVIFRKLSSRKRAALMKAVPPRQARGFGHAVRWPSRDEAERMLEAVREAREEWREKALELVESVQDGCLPNSALQVSRYVDAPEILYRLNRKERKTDARERLLSSADYLERAEATLCNLASPKGWLSLHTAWLIRVLEQIWQRQVSGRSLKELSRREVLWPIANLNEVEAKKPLAIYDRAPVLNVARRRQLSRERAECVDRPLPVLDPEDVALFVELAQEWQSPAGLAC